MWKWNARSACDGVGAAAADSVSKLLVQGGPDGGQEVHGVQVHVLLDILHSVNTDGKILGHLARVDGFDAGFLEHLAETLQLLVAVQLGTVVEAAGPREDGSHGVGGGGTTLLVLTVMASHGAVRGF